MPYGTLVVVCGPMFAGKTTEILRRILWGRQGEHKTVLAIKTSFDTRYSVDKIVSHDGLSSPVHSISKWNDIEHLVNDAELVCFDEIQFFNSEHFDKDIVLIIKELLQNGKDVIVSGLDMDWKGDPFEITAKLMAMADEIIKKTAYCTQCGRPATKTYKKEKENISSIELGNNTLYEARCNTHWTSENDNTLL